jgi:predicted RNase H-like nuclease (RuvC/YqgF family)
MTGMVPIKIICHCGQKYAFEVQPVDGRMPVAVNCPVCGRDGTIAANESIRKMLHGRTQPLPPPSVAAVLQAAQSSLESHLVEALKDAVVQELASQRRELLAGQQQAAAELTELARRLEAVQTPMLERLRAYEKRIAELEKELSEQSKENRELLQLKIEMTRRQLESERSRINFN